MNTNRYGKINIIPGENGGRFPFCNSLFVDDAVRVIVDPGAGISPLSIIDPGSIDLVINTHFHFDHIAYNYLFTNARILLNEFESGCFRNRREISDRLGMTRIHGETWVEGWLSRISQPGSVQSPYSPQNRHEWWLSSARLDGTFKWDEVFNFGTTTMEVIGAPGHTSGFNCLFFPGEGVVYTGDVDLTSFGPWYANEDSDIDLFITSAKRIADLDAEVFVTGHDVGILNKRDFKSRLHNYLNIINLRDEKILSHLAQPLDIREITSLGICYGKRFLVDDWLRAWEQVQIEKHLDRLVRWGLVTNHQSKFART